MNITTTGYYELPAPLAIIRPLLRDADVWTQLPLQASRTGQFWQWGRDLYQVAVTELAPHESSGFTTPTAAVPQSAEPETLLCWQIEPLTTRGRWLQVELALYDSVITTHVLARVSLLGDGHLWPWDALLTRRQLQRMLDACALYLRDLVRTQQNTSLPPAVGAPAASTLYQRLRTRYPQTVAAFEAMGAHDHLERIWRLEHGWEQILRGETDASIYTTTESPTAQASPDYDLIYAGGGLGLLHAAVMVRNYGRRVLLFDRSEVGSVHREWNISRAELQALVDLELVSWDELAPVIMRAYRSGVVRFYTGPHSNVPHSELWFPDVLNVALDAGALLRLMRQKFEEAGGIVLDRRSLQQVQVATADGGPLVTVLLDNLATSQTERYTAQLLLDGMGSTSPLALFRHRGDPFAGVCPTVGTVASGFVAGAAPHEFTAELGDILVSVADSQDGKQMIWEGFPGRHDELTVYLFYYAALKNAGRPFEWPPLSAPPLPGSTNGTSDPQPRYSLLALFEHYFALLPSYKRPGPAFRHIKPVYGYIPGRHSVRSQEAPLLRGVLPAGDSAAQQSPLTYCGFGSHVRNLRRTTSLLDYALRHNLREPRHLRHISAFQTNVSLNWVFSRFMQPWGNPQGVNELQNAFLVAMNELGITLATRFFRDQMRWHDYNRVVWRTMTHYPDVFRLAFLILGVPGVWHWLNDYLRFSQEAALAVSGRAVGERSLTQLANVLENFQPALALALRARLAEWRVMGWLDTAEPSSPAPQSTTPVEGAYAQPS